MDVFEITGFRTGLDESGVNFLNPKDAFSSINNGYIFRQELKSRKGFTRFSTGRLLADFRIMGIFENVNPATNEAELLVCDTNFLYRYNNSTNTFDPIVFNSVDPIAGFLITNNEDYISGTTYLTKTGAQRFVFTGKGMTDIFFYDGTDVKRFTNVIDNPDYQAPALGALTKADHIMWFKERLNLFSPTIGGVNFKQAVLYSGVRDQAGNGDKFNTVGSGRLEADTFEQMRGAKIFGNTIIMNFQRSTWVLEKTNDAFNPFLIKRIPSVLGTDATFSGVVWADELKSIGKTGMLSTNGNNSLRFDDKLPFFTQNEIDPLEFELTYGGFDRGNDQFMFAYRQGGSQLTDITQDKVLVYNYKESTWSINDQRFSVFGQTDDGINLTWDDIDENENPSWGRWDTTEEIWDKIGIGVATQKTLAGDNDGFIYQIETDFDDYFASISAITQASSAVVTAVASAFKIGDKVVFQNVEGMTEINERTGEQIGTVTATSYIPATTNVSITVDINSSGFSAYTTGGTISKVIDFEVLFSPFNPYREEGRRVNVSHVEVLLDKFSGDNFLEFFVDDETSPINKERTDKKEKTTSKVLLSPDTASLKNRQWITAVINQEANFISFKISRESFASQTKIYSIRVFASRGSKTSN